MKYFSLSLLFLVLVSCSSDDAGSRSFDFETAAVSESITSSKGNTTSIRINGETQEILDFAQVERINEVNLFQRGYEILLSEDDYIFGSTIMQVIWLDNGDPALNEAFISLDINIEGQGTQSERIDLDFDQVNLSSNSFSYSDNQVTLNFSF